MRRTSLAGAAAVAASAAIVACGSSSPGASGSPSPTPTTATTACSHASIQKELHAKGVLTVATDNPVFTPWFDANNNPASGKGYESAVAYAIAKQLGFTASQVHWVHEAFTKSYAPGPKPFDFDINEVSVTADRATAVTFSDSYYAVQQAIVALKGSPIVTKHSPAQLKTYTYGDSIGTTGLTFITNNIQPATKPKVFNTLADAAAALAAHRFAALVTDTPTAQYMASGQLKHAVLVAQFPSTGEHYGLVFHLGNPLVTCVNKAIATLKSNGTLQTLQHKYLGIYLNFPTIKP